MPTKCEHPSRLAIPGPLHSSKYPLGEVLGLGSGLARRQFLDVGTGHPARLLARHDDSSFDLRVAFNSVQHCLKVSHKRAAKRVHRLSFHVERKDGDAVVLDFHPEVLCIRPGRHRARSRWRRRRQSWAPRGEASCSRGELKSAVEHCRRDLSRMCELQSGSRGFEFEGGVANLL